MKRTVKSRVDTDWTMKELFRCLRTDSKAAVGFYLLPDYSRMLTANVRERVEPSMFCWNSAYKLKWHYQLASLWQRYRFKDEPLTEQQLNEVTFNKFRGNLDRVATVTLDHPLASSVLKKAKKNVLDILGTYSEDEMQRFCKFGARSTVGNPLSRSYLDLKLAGPITGSCKQLTWFYEEYLKNDLLLAEIVGTSEPVKADYLKVALVPKSHKIKRPILPNTLIGNFHSAGVGDYMVEKLKSAGLDITRLQNRHRALVKSFSVSRSHVTADLSAASDSITVGIVKALLPKDWYDAVNVDYYPLIDVEGDVRSNPCFCTMGIGFTFPLQTLLFYCLLMAIKELAGCTKGFCSVYGDDLIYPRIIHRHVSVIFPLLGFILNMDKTYAKEYFRESCGADFYRGVDVRPFKPMATCERLSKHNYSRFIYKLINGLLDRWDKSEIPTTLFFLYKEVAISTGEIYVVPPSFPATSGVKCECAHELLYPLVTKHPKWCYVKKEKQCLWRFSRLVDKDDMRTVRRVLPYYWVKLRHAQELQEPVRNYGTATPQLLSIMASYYKRKFHDEEHALNSSHYGSDREILRWIQIRGGKLIPYVTRKAEKVAEHATAHVHSWK